LEINNMQQWRGFALRQSAILPRDTFRSEFASSGSDSPSPRKPEEFRIIALFQLFGVVFVQNFSSNGSEESRQPDGRKRGDCLWSLFFRYAARRIGANKLAGTVSEDKMMPNEAKCPAKDAGRKPYGKMSAKSK